MRFRSITVDFTIALRSVHNDIKSRLYARKVVCVCVTLDYVDMRVFITAQEVFIPVLA